MQFAYQFPERIERLVLVASGGLGKEVSPLLKTVTLPGAEYVLPVLLNTGGSGRSASGPRGLARRLGWRPGVTLRGVAQLHHADRQARPARLRPHRPVGHRRVAGQRVQRDRLYLAEALPTLIVWE